MSKWTGVDAMFSHLERVPEEVFESRGAIVEDIVEEAVVHQRAVLTAATTRTGFERMSRGRGNGPGRDDTGEMKDTITSKVTRTGDRIVGEWGWEDPDGYELAQDYGLGRIPAARSLFISFLAAREKLRAAVRSGR